MNCGQKLSLVQRKCILTSSSPQFIALAVAEKISALTTEGYLQERASRGDRTSYEAVLAKVADVKPELHDQLPPTS